MKRGLRLGLTIGAATVLAVGTAWLWLATRARDRVVAALPAAPELSDRPAALQDRIAAAGTRARSPLHARRGLRELVRLYHANGFLAEALAGYTALAQLEPTEARWPHLHATILAGYGDLAAALPLWQRAVELAPDYLPARLRLGDALLKTNRPAEAALAYEQVLAREPENPHARLGLARLDFEAQRWEAARAKLEQIVNQTNYALGYDLIVSLYERLGLAQRATAIRARAKASGAYRDAPDPWVDGLIEDCYDPYRLALAAGFLGGSGDVAGGRRLLERAVEIAPDDVSARFQLGTLLVSQGDLAAAHRELERCTVLAPEFADAWAHLSSLQARQGRADAAERTLAQGLKNCPGSPGLHLMAARNHRQAGRLGPAIVEFQESIRLRPNEAEAYLELGQLYIRADRDTEGIAVIRQALAAEPGNPIALSILAFDAITHGTEADARAWFARVRNQPRIDGDQLNHLARAFQQRFGRAP